MRLMAYGGVSTLSTTCAVLAAFRQRANFYAASVYLSKSNACMMILCNFGIFCTIILAKVLQSIFFGQLRLAEIERVNDRLWFTISETLLALAMFRDEFDTSFVVLFISLIFVKVFHWLAAYRVEWMDQTTSPPGKLFHARMISVLSIIWITDMLLIAYATESVLLHGPSVVLMFEMEYIIMQVTCLSIICKYILNSYAHYRAQEHWEGKSTYQFYIDLATDFLKLLTYIGFLSLTLTFHGLPINVLRDVYYTFRSFVTKCNNLVRFRQATRNMNERYPNATRAEMESLADKTCIICREDMEFRDEHEPPVAGEPRQNNNGNGAGPATGPNDTPKKLVCGHIFHFHCLRSWLERQQTCPTCRRPVIQAPAATQVAPQNPNAAANRVFAAAMAAAGAGPPPIPPPAVPGAGRGGPPPAPPGLLPAAQAGQPAQAGAGEGNLMGTRPDGTRQDFHHRMREFEQRFAAAATTTNSGGPNVGPPGPSSQVRQQAQSRNNPLLQFDLSSHSSPNSSRPLAGPLHLRFRTSPGSHSITSTGPAATFPSSSRASVLRNNSQISGLSSSVQAPTGSLGMDSQAQSELPKAGAEPSLGSVCGEDRSRTDEADDTQEDHGAQASYSDQEIGRPADSGVGDQMQAKSVGGSKVVEKKARLPRLIPLFDRSSFSSSGSTLDSDSRLLDEYQRRLNEFGERKRGLVSSSEQDPKLVELLAIQGCLVDCCSRLVNLMEPLEDRSGSLIDRSSSSRSEDQRAVDRVEQSEEQFGKGKGKGE